MPNLTTKQKGLLKSIEAGGENGVLLEPSDELKALIDAKLVQNKTLADGKVQARSSKYDSEPNGEAPAESAPAETSDDFVLKVAGQVVADLLPMAPAQRGGRKVEQYPFSKLEVGQSFLVPATEKYPKPWESFASTVSSATRRCSEKTGQVKTNKKGKQIEVLKATKKFTLRKVTKGDTYPNKFVEPFTGARVFRIQ